MIVKATTDSNIIGVVQAEEIKSEVIVGNCFVKQKDRTCLISIINNTEDAVEIAALHVNLEEISAETENDATKINFLATNIHYKQLICSETLEQLIRVQHLNVVERKAIYAICEEYINILFLEGDPFIHTTALEHHIATRIDSSPANVKPLYYLPEKHKLKVKQQVHDMLASKVIRPSTSQ